MLDEVAFREFLLEKKVDDEQATIFVSRLQDLETFLKSEDIDNLPWGTILEFTEHLVKTDADTVLDALRALIHYGNFIRKYDYIAEVLDIGEAYNAMDNLAQRVGEQYGEEVRDEIFADLTIPPLGVDPETKFEVTKVLMKRLEQKLGETKTIELLAPCLHGRPIEPSLKDREELLRLNDIDAFLKFKHKETVDRMRQHKKDGTLEWGQYVDDAVIAYVENTLTLSPGIRKGNRIISTKIPFLISKMLAAENERMKRYYACYCPWVRGAIKDGTDREISANFCHCSAGFTKKYWDVVFDQPVTVEPIETALTGALHCKFAIPIPEQYQKKKKSR